MNNRDRYNNIYGRGNHQTYPSNTWQYRGDNKDNSTRRNDQNPPKSLKHYTEGSIRRNKQYSPKNHSTRIFNDIMYSPDEENQYFGDESLYLSQTNSIPEDQNENRSNTFGRRNEQNDPRYYDTDGEIIRRLPRYNLQDTSRNSDGYNQNRGKKLILLIC